MDALDRARRLGSARTHRVDERPDEADIGSLVRPGVGRIGWQVGALSLIASLQLAAITLYVIPQTSMLGAVLLTGYMGGAIASYVRIGEFSPPMVPLTTAVLAWLGLFLRDARLRKLLPIRWR